MARKNLRNMGNPFKARKNGLDTHFYSIVKDVEKELIKKDQQLRSKAASYVIRVVKKKLANPTGDVPDEAVGSFTKGIRKRSARYYTDVGIGDPGFHAMNVEYGHDIVRDGKKVGEAKPHPFLKPSFEESAPVIKAILSETRIEND